MRAATALNLRAVFISSENRHISTTLIVSHFRFFITLQGLSLIHFFNEARKRQWERASEPVKGQRRTEKQLCNSFQKWFAKKDGKACGKHKRFSVSTVPAKHSHTRTGEFLFLSLLFRRLSHTFTLFLFFRFYLFWN
jgi:hypothetical protein